jgi:hypothetical protein
VYFLQKTWYVRVEIPECNALRVGRGKLTM